MGPYGWAAVAAKHFKSFLNSAWSKTRIQGGERGFVLDVLWTATETPPRAKHFVSTPITLTGRVTGGKIERLRVDYNQEEVRKQLGLGDPGGG